jgi:hypothetical protein
MRKQPGAGWTPCRRSAAGECTRALGDSSTTTGDSFGKWLNANRDAITETQTPSAVMWLESIANALKVTQGELADAIKSEICTNGSRLRTLCQQRRHRRCADASGSKMGGVDTKRVGAMTP